MAGSTKPFWWAAFFIVLFSSMFSSYRTGVDINRLMHDVREPQYIVVEELYSLPLFDNDNNSNNSSSNTQNKERYKDENSYATISSEVNSSKATIPHDFPVEDIKTREEEVPKRVKQPIQQPIIAEGSFEDDDGDANKESFSACILWMDDNHRLEEWLAYHYYLLKLRYVVMNIDPFSRTSPKAIVDRWNDGEKKYNLNMTIVTMTDSDYVEDFDGEMKKIEITRNLSTDQEYQLGNAKTQYHRTRQHAFYKACSTHLVEQNKSWTSYHDTDEFFTFEHQAKIGGKMKDITADSIRKMEKPGYVLHRLNFIKRQQPPDSHVNNTGLSCLYTPRRRFCANELSKEETNNLFALLPDSTSDGIVPKGFMNSSIDSGTYKDRASIIRRFDTLRYKYLTPGPDGMPKSIMDLSQRNPRLYIKDKWYERNHGSWFAKKEGPHKWNTHRPMQHLCIHEENNRLSEIKKLVEEERFIVHHYLGSFESYSFRDDARQGGLRTYQIYEERSHETQGEFSHVIRPWVRGFTELIGGPEVATYLLQDAGKFPEDYDIVSRIHDYNMTYDLNKLKKQPTRKRRKGKKRIVL